MTAEQRYFDKVTYKPTYQIGDRIRGRFNGVPFAGKVAVDTMIDEDAGPYVMVFLDLPIKLDNSTHTIVKVSHDDILTKGESFGKPRSKRKG